MKFLHTSDWHVGRTIRNRSRSHEHRAVFAEIIDIARREQVDAVLLTGDIFHERRPALEGQELLAETLAELARQQISPVIIPGNHDDPSLLRALKPLGDLVQVHIVSEVGEELDSLIVPLGDRGGKEKAPIGCLPYLHPHQVLSAADGAGTSEDARMSAYQTKLQVYFRALDPKTRRPVIGNVQGGLSGPAIKPIALLMVKKVYEVAGPKNVPIIGQGGITTVSDAIEFLVAGATAIGLGTGLFYDPLLCPKINAGIAEYLRDTGIDSVTRLRGSLAERATEDCAG